jgi:hypothetical protein
MRMCAPLPTKVSTVSPTGSGCDESEEIKALSFEPFLSGSSGSFCEERLSDPGLSRTTFLK